jgi:hypothetical protein
MPRRTGPAGLTVLARLADGAVAITASAPWGAIDPLNIAAHIDGLGSLERRPRSLSLSLSLFPGNLFFRFFKDFAGGIPNSATDCLPIVANPRAQMNHRFGAAALKRDFLEAYIRRYLCVEPDLFYVKCFTRSTRNLCDRLLRA